MEGGSVYNLTLDNVNLSLGSIALGSSSYSAGLISGDAYGLTNIISNITIIDSGVRGTSSSGTGGLIGSIINSGTIVNIDNIKATNLKVFSTNSSVGGITGSIIDSGAQVNISDIDIQGELFSDASSSYTGGIIGTIKSGAGFNLNRAIVDMTSQNTLETSSAYYLEYSQSYLGGMIGFNQSSSTDVFITDVFFTGELVTRTSRQERNVGTLNGRSGGTQTVSNAYYSQVLFGSTGSTTYTLSKAPKGEMSILVNASTMPSITWWNSFSTPFNVANSLWAQDGTTGQLYLIR